MSVDWSTAVKAPGPSARDCSDTVALPEAEMTSTATRWGPTLMGVVSVTGASSTRRVAPVPVSCRLETAVSFISPT